MDKGKPRVNYEICMACGICTTACPVSCLSMTKADVDKYKKAYPELLVAEKCISCHMCEKACPIDAIKLI